MKQNIAWALVGFALGATATNLIYITLLRR
jgi:hypothetical protein